jgi:hypothetical protein
MAAKPDALVIWVKRAARCKVEKTPQGASKSYATDDCDAATQYEQGCPFFYSSERRYLYCMISNCCSSSSAAVRETQTGEGGSTSTATLHAACNMQAPMTHLKTQEFEGSSITLSDSKACSGGKVHKDTLEQVHTCV